MSATFHPRLQVHITSAYYRRNHKRSDMQQQPPHQNGNGNSHGPPTQGAYYNLDPSTAAKQMAALNSAAKARRATQGPADQTSVSPPIPLATISSYQPHASPTSAMPLPQQQQQQHQQQQQQQAHAVRARGFLHGLANFMSSRGTPLPPAITGVAVPYDPNTSPWKALDPTAEPGGVRILGRDLDLYRLFHIVVQTGGSERVTERNGWGSIAQACNLPPELPNPQTGAMVATVPMLINYFKHILTPFEEVYLSNIAKQRQAQQAKAQTSNLPIPPPIATSSSTSSLNMQQPQQLPQSGHRPPMPLPQPGSQVFTPTTPANQGRSSMESPQRHGSVPSATTPHNPSSGVEVGDELGSKRKREESSEADLKRPRINGDVDGADAAIRASQPQRTVRQKVEYVPIVREIDTHGGRNVDAIDEEVYKITARRGLQPADEWGQIDIEGSVMSLKSRLPAEVSYAITTFALLSTMRGQTPNSGFPLTNADDLLDEMLDYLRELAFGEEDVESLVPESQHRFYTNRELLELVNEEENELFCGLKPTLQGDIAPGQPPSAYIFGILNLLRNFSLTGENQITMSKAPQVMNLLLQISEFKESGSSSVLCPASPALTMRDLMHVQRDVLHILLNLAGNIEFDTYEPQTIRRLFAFTASFLIDPQEAIGPTAQAMLLGTSQHAMTPPMAADLALDLFTKVAQPDANRRLFAQHVPESEQWRLFEVLVHRMPVTDVDFKIANNDAWFQHMEKLVFSMYCIGFIASPALKNQIRDDRRLGFATVFLRLIKRYTIVSNEYRQFFQPLCRRAIETLKLIDDGGNSFEHPQVTMPQVAFGMGYGEHGNSKVEKGMGILSGYQEDVTWGIMRALVDPSTFSEVESLARVGI